jgi:proline dehydrogenase
MDVMNVLSHFDDTKTAFSYKSNYELKRAYILFKLLSYPSLAFIGKHLLNLLIKIHFPIDNLIKKTIFEQFCGGENEKECFKVINKLNENNIRCILNYSIEGSNTESSYEHTLNKTLNLIDLSEKQSVSSFIVFKPSAVGRFDLYLKKTNNDSLNKNEIDEWQRVEQRYDQICNSAAKSGISILIDAEESWIQKSIDELIEKLMIKYNNSSCIVYNTIQTYRIDRFEYLSDLHKRLSKSNIKIGIKLVRGAYM